MGEMRQTINLLYSRGRIDALIEYANNITVDEDDRELARELAIQLRNKAAAEKIKKDDGKER